MKKLQELNYKKQIDDCLGAETWEDFQDKDCKQIERIEKDNTDLKSHRDKLYMEFQDKRIISQNKKMSDLTNQKRKDQQDLEKLNRELIDNQNKLKKLQTEKDKDQAWEKQQLEEIEREIQLEQQLEQENKKRLNACTNTETIKDFVVKGCDEDMDITTKNHFDKLRSAKKLQGWFRDKKKQEQPSQAKTSLFQKIKEHPKKAVAGVAVVGIGGVLVYNYVLPKPKPKKKSKKRSM